MGKRIFIAVNANGRNYKVYMDDVVKVHSIGKLRKPRVPAYDSIESPTAKYEPILDVEF